MAMKPDREYRNLPINFRSESEEDDYIVRGYASTFDRYDLFSDGDITIYEQIDRHAFDGADMSDVIFLLNHEGMVYARNKNNTLALSIDDHGLFTETNLKSTRASQDIYEAIKTGLLDQMSFAFTVEDDEFDRSTNTRIIHRIGKVYDVSVVDRPANKFTAISARTKDYCDGVIAEIREAERLQREKAEALLERKRELLAKLGKEL